MLDVGADINTKNESGSTALMFAAQFSNTTSSLETVKLLLDRGADINRENENGSTALMFAARNTNSTSSLDTVRLLLDRGANINMQNKYGRTVLIETIFILFNSDTSSLETVRLLLDRGADTNIQDDRGWTPLIIAAQYSRSSEILELLLDRGADINIQDNYKRTALIYTVLYSNDDRSLENVRLLLDRGANVNTKDKGGDTALIYASGKERNNKTVKLLLDRGADVFAKNNDNKSAFDRCSTSECKDLISKYIWEKLYNRDKDTARRYAKQTIIPKDVWEMILLNKRQQELCKNLSTDKNKEILILFAREFGVVTEGLTKAKLCGIVARQLAYGRYLNTKIESEMDKNIREIKITAKRYGIDTNQSIDKILADLGQIFK